MNIFPEKPFLPPIHFRKTPSSWSGTLFHLLGQGMGDTVNGLRIVDVLKSCYPRCRHVVYCDNRWTDFLNELSDLEIRHYPQARDPRHPDKGVVGPSDWALNDIRRSVPTDALLGYWPYLLADQMARGESTQESIVRALGLDEVIEEFRPLVVTGEKDRTLAQRVLERNGLEDGKYIVMAPHTWPDKAWGNDNFSWLGRKLFEECGTRIIVLGLSELGPLDIDGVLNLFDLPLGAVAELIKHARIFIGLDSGLSHVAASFDLPIIVLYAQGKIPAFEIRVHSPSAWLFLEAFPGQPIVKEQVYHLADHMMKGQEPSLRQIPACPACGRPLRYVVEATEALLNLRCVCGTQTMEKITGIDLMNGKNAPSAIPESEAPFISRTEGSSLPGRIRFPTVIKSVKPMEELLPGMASAGRNGGPSFHVVLPVRNPYRPVLAREVSSPEGRGGILLSLDGVLFLFRSMGYFPVKMERVREDPPLSGGSGENNLLEIVFAYGSDHLEKLEVPWGGRKLTVSDAREYFSWFSWQSWATPLRWDGLAKRAMLTGSDKDAVLLALRIIRLDPSFKSLKYLLKSILHDGILRFLNGQE